MIGGQGNQQSGVPAHSAAALSAHLNEDFGILMMTLPSVKSALNGTSQPRSSTFGSELSERAAGTIRDIPCWLRPFTKRNRHLMPPGRRRQSADFPSIFIARSKVASLGPIDVRVAFRRYERRVAFVDRSDPRHGRIVQGRTSYQQALELTCKILISSRGRGGWPRRLARPHQRCAGHHPGGTLNWRAISGLIRSRTTPCQNQYSGRTAGQEHGHQ